MAGLLVSVRSAEEAVAAYRGGATIIDVKEPDRGPLGRADVEVWQAVRHVLPSGVPVSVALGELTDEGPNFDCDDFGGVAYRKVGLAQSGPDWRERWAEIRDRPGPSWVAVAYADWRIAKAPPPIEVLEAALQSDCVGILVDTWQKSQRTPIGPSWAVWIGRARRSGLIVALAGGLGEADIERLSPLRPDLFAVRGAACHDGRRSSTIDPKRVTRLAAAAARSGVGPHAAAELSPAAIRARIVSAASSPARIQSGTPTPSR